MRIHDPDVVYTDLGLAILGAILAWRLWTHTQQSALTRSGVVVMAALASAALFGALFHAFFPADSATRAAYFAWIPVSLSILVVAATLLTLGLRVLLPQWPSAVRGGLVALYAASFAVVVLFVDDSYSTIVRFYAPMLILFLIAAVREAARGADGGWWLLAISFGISIIAALMQQARVAIHSVYFDHNALYHVLQGIALVLLYLGFRRVGRSDPAYRAQ
ncbi:MAG: DUF6962 family protein [Gemmatimonadaceae bacterium]